MRYMLLSLYFVSVPNVDETDTYIYEIDSDVKYSVEENKFIDLHVHKEWDDQSDSYQKRPASIDVDLLKDGEKVETVTLDSSNGWSYDWKDLDTAYSWSVSEVKVPEEYTMSIKQDGHTIVIVNKIKPDIQRNLRSPNTPPELPYTGTMKWLAVVLAIAGVSCLCIGYIMHKRNDK